MRKPVYTNDITRKRTAGSVFGRIVKWTLILVLLACAGAAAYFGVRGWALYAHASQEKSVEQMAEDIHSQAEYVTLDQLPTIYTNAVVAVEDHRFWQHPGFDALATGRALVNDIRAGEIVEGGSTIAQQLAKNEFFTQEQVIERKVAEVFMAFDIESKLSKSEILELYVNSIYFGDGYEGIGAACKGYLGKHASEMTDCEATLMAGIPNAPSAYAPTENPELARQRQMQVLRAMVKYGALTQGQADTIAVNPCEIDA